SLASATLVTISRRTSDAPAPAWIIPSSAALAAPALTSASDRPWGSRSQFSARPPGGKRRAISSGPKKEVCVPLTTRSNLPMGRSISSRQWREPQTVILKPPPMFPAGVPSTPPPRASKPAAGPGPREAIIGATGGGGWRLGLRKEAKATKYPEHNHRNTAVKTRHSADGTARYARCQWNVLVQKKGNFNARLKCLHP